MNREGAEADVNGEYSENTMALSRPQNDSFKTDFDLLESENGKDFSIIIKADIDLLYK